MAENFMGRKEIIHSEEVLGLAGPVCCVYLLKPKTFLHLRRSGKIVP